MTASDHIASFAIGAAGVAVSAGAVAGAVGVVASAVGAAVGVVGITTGAAVAAEFKPRTAIAGGLTAAAAIVFAAYQLGGRVPELPAKPPATAPTTTFIVEGTCKGIQTTPYTDKAGGRIDVILPPGCTLKP